MPNARHLRVPSYRHHRPSGQAVVTLDGRDFYLGPWNSHASKDNYDRLIDATETFQHQIDISGLMLILRRGPAAKRSKQAVSELRMLQHDPAEFHAEMFWRHERSLKEWKGKK